MDLQTPQRLAAQLVGKTIGGWSIVRYINHGKSAAVFEGSKGSQRAAVKVFDPDIVARYGREAQLKRINRELSLVGKTHPHLITLYEGGEDGAFLYVAMEFFEGRNLADALHEIPRVAIRTLIAQVASAAKHLEGISFAHRDIKPENIGVSNDLNSAKLLDLGVIRPFDLTNVTDEGDQRFFVGTLQYSPPELLFREEEQSLEAWRAITFYQLGAVLHDLLVRKPLFEEHRNPYARMVRAVEREIPRIDASEADADLRLLAQNCLAKTPTHRLDTVKWDDFSQPPVTDPLDAARRRIALHRTESSAAPEPSQSIDDLVRMQAYSLRTSIESAVVSTIRAERLPRYSSQRIRDPNPYLLRTLFEPSPNDSFKRWFALYSQGTVLDARTNLLELRLSACTSPTRESVPAEPNPSEPARTVRGALIDQDVRMHVQQFLVLSYARALDTPVGTASVQWLVSED